MNSKSHAITLTSLTRALAERGHELVVVSSYPLEKPHSNYTDIDVSSSFANFHSLAPLSSFLSLKRFCIKEHFMLVMKTCEVTERIVSNPKVKNLLNDKRGFQIIIIEDLFSEALFGFTHFFKVI
jgi:hypothetical protein